MAGETITATVDSTVLNRQVERLSTSSKKLLPDIANQRLLNAVGRGFNKTPIADKAKIITELGEVGRNLRLTKTGKLRRGSKIFASSTRSKAPLMALIINARRRKAGKKGLFGRDMEAAIVKAVAARKRSVGFEKSGYIPGMRVVASRLKRPFKIARTKGISVYGKNKGEGIAARDGWSPYAMIENSAKEIPKVGRDALQEGVDEEAREVERHLVEDMKPVFDEFNRAS